MTYNNDATYTAHVGTTPGGEAIELVIRKAVPAGIDGPHGTIQLEGLDLGDVRQALATRGYTLAQDWQFVHAYDGLRLEARLSR